MLYPDAGDDAVDGNGHRFHVVGYVDKVRRKVGVVNHVDGGDGGGFAASRNVLVDDAFSRPRAGLEVLRESELEGNIAVGLTATLQECHKTRNTSTFGTTGIRTKKIVERRPCGIVLRMTRKI